MSPKKWPCRITEQYPITHDPTVAPLPYGRWAPLLLERWLRSASVEERERTLYTLCDYLHDPEHVYECISAGHIPRLANLLSDRSVIVRQMSAECLTVFASHAVGRQAIISHDVIESIVELLDDQNDAVRLTAHQLLEMLLFWFEGRKLAVEMDLVPLLLKKSASELDDIKELVLSSLHGCLQLQTSRALECGAVDILGALIGHHLPEVRAGAATCLCDVARTTDGKQAVVDGEVLPLLIHLLEDTNERVQCQASAALMMAAVTTEGKMAASQLGAVSKLLQLTDASYSDELRLHAVQCLANLASEPTARQLLREVIQHLEMATTSENGVLKEAARRALKTITWNP